MGAPGHGVVPRLSGVEVPEAHPARPGGRLLHERRGVARGPAAPEWPHLVAIWPGQRQRPRVLHRLLAVSREATYWILAVVLREYLVELRVVALHRHRL